MLYNQKDLLDRLREEGIFTAQKTTFIEAVNRGQIPYEIPEGKKTKHYKYKKVVNALRKAGIGKPLTPEEKLDKLPDPKAGQSQAEYQEEVAELGAGATITDANIYKTIYQGKLEKLKYEKEQGLLISRDEVENLAFAVSRSIRDKILSIPERMSNELASIDDAHTIKELLYKEFGTLLDGFSHESFLND